MVGQVVGVKVLTPVRSIILSGFVALCTSCKCAVQVVNVLYKAYMCAAQGVHTLYKCCTSVAKWFEQAYTNTLRVPRVRAMNEDVRHCEPDFRFLLSLTGTPVCRAFTAATLQDSKSYNGSTTSRC